MVPRRRFLAAMLFLSVAFVLVSGGQALAADARWTARYWNNPTLSGTPVVIQEENAINYDWADNRPTTGVLRDNFSVRWTRRVNFREGVYRFTATSDDGMRVWVGDNLIIDQWYDHRRPETVSADVALTTGEHRIKVEYYEKSGKAVAKLTWESLGPAVINNWKGQYYNSRDLKGTPVLVRDDAAINFNWGEASPVAGIVSRDNFSVRWTRTLNFDAKLYRFTATSDDGMRVWVDDKKIIDQWYDHTPRTISAEVALTAGEHAVRVEYYENAGVAVAGLSWTPVGPIATDTWKGKYYNATPPGGTPVLVRDDAAIDFDWGESSPAEGVVNNDGFSVRWTRTVNLKEGTYRFTATSDDGMRVWVDDNLVIDQWYDHSALTASADVKLSAGDHRIKVEYYDASESAIARLSWKRR